MFRLLVELRNLILILFLVAFGYTKAQDSLTSKTKVPPLSFLSSYIESYYKTSHLLDDKKYLAAGKNRVEMAGLPVFLNSEKQMIDGTNWKLYSDINYTRFFSVLGMMAAVDLAAYLYQREVWYREETTVFHALDFVEDMNKWQYMDKFGHFTDAYFVSDLSSKAYRWSGISGSSSVWFGALTGWLWLLQIEISDGFMAEWGFSWGDMLANTLGSGFFVLQQFNYEALGGIHPKFSWHKSDAWKEGRYYRDPGGLIEDYEGMTFWLAVNFHHYFPDSWKKDYPEWLAPLGLAVGYGAKGIAGNPWGGRKEIFIGLDIDLRKIPLGDDSGFLRFLKSEFNFIRLPLPTVRFSESGVWFGLYF